MTAAAGTAATSKPVASAGGSAATSSCAKSFNPYLVSRSFLAACGEHTYPRQAVRALPGGGRAYVYNVAGVSISIPIPPAGFNPLTAPASKLAEYGFPPRPAGGLALRYWINSARKAHPVQPPAYLVSGRPTNVTVKDNPIWAGNVATSHTYTNVYTYWLEPGIHQAECPNPQAESTWAGLGGVNTGVLAQAGTQYGESGGSAHQGWIELINSPTYDHFIWSTVTATVGGEFHVNVYKDSDGYSIYLENDYTGASQPNDIDYFTHFDGSTAEFIAEDPYGGVSSGHYLIRFDTFEVQDAEASDDGGSVYHGLANWPHDDYVMQGPVTHNTMAYAGSAFNSGDSWYDYHQNCQ